MTTPTTGLRAIAYRTRCLAIRPTCRTKTIGGPRTFSTTKSHLEEKSDDTKITQLRDTLSDAIEPGQPSSNGRSGSNTQPGDLLRQVEEVLSHPSSSRQFKRKVSQDPEYRKIPPFRGLPRWTAEPGFMNMGQSRTNEPQEDIEWGEDDMPVLAQGQLEQHREFREYARLAAWEMPLLSKMAKPFVPPTSKEVLRFRYTTYLGEEHPAEKKVVVEFCPADMPDLTSAQVLKLKKLAGVRYNPETDIVKMSCEMFPNQAQNKRYLGDLVETMLREARDLTDTFEDVPLDLRHHRFKTKPKFPVEWRMTAARRAELEAARQQASLPGPSTLLINGVKQIEDALAAMSKGDGNNAQAELIMAPRGQGKGRQSRQAPPR